MKDDFIKIINETYKLLDFFPESEPLKNRAKERVLIILENMTILSEIGGWVSLKKEKAAAELIDDIEILDSYLKLGKHQGWIDTMNFLIIRKEYQGLKEKINPPKGLQKSGLILTEPIIEEKPLIERQVPTAPKAAPQIEKTNNYSERQQRILKILSVREKTQVADIIREIPNITKRTIRRDMDDLLKKGKITRVGEWNQVFYKING